jgi:hypothetical protein
MHRFYRLRNTHDLKLKICLKEKNMKLYDSPRVNSVFPRFISQTQSGGLSQIVGCIGDQGSSCQGLDETGIKRIGMCVNGVEDGSELSGYLVSVAGSCNFTVELENCQNSVEHEGECPSLVGSGLAVECFITIDCDLEDCSPSVPSDVTVTRPDGDVITCENVLNDPG